MRTKRIALFAAAVALILVFGVMAVHVFAAPPDWTVTQLTSGDNPSQGAQVSGDRVVWHSSDGAHDQLFTWKIGDSTPTTLTSGPNESEEQVIDGDRIAWVRSDGANLQIVTQKVGDSTPTTLTTDAHEHETPQVSGDRIVWVGFLDSTHRQVFTWKVGDSSATTLTTSAPFNTYEEVSGDRVVWQGFDGLGNSEIYTWKVGDSSPTTITAGTSSVQTPQVSGDRVVWVGSEGPYGQIYTFKVGDSATTTLTTDANNHGYPQVSGDRVVWQGIVDGYWNIFTWHSGDSTATRVTPGEYNSDNSPQVSGDRIVWYGGGMNRQVFTQKVGESQATTLSVAGTDNLFPYVSGDHVVWALKDGSNWQVFDAEPANTTVVFPDPELDAGIRATIGMPSGPIHPSDLATTTFLQFEDQGIQRLDGMQYLTNLTGFDFIGNQIATITPLGGLSKLTYVNLGTNLIRDVSPLAGLSNLTQADLDHNRIVDITPLHDLPFSDVDVSHNWLDLTPGSTASQTIDWWLDHNSIVTWLPQNVGAVTGTVRDVSNKVLPGATVSLGSGSPTATTLSGSYTIDGVSAGIHTATISASYYHSQTTTFSVEQSTTTVNGLLSPVQIPLSIKRSPSGSTLTIKRKKGVAKFTLAAVLSDARGAVMGKVVWLQKSSNGKKWSNLYKLTTSAAGKASKAMSIKAKSTTYYRWSAAATPFDAAATTGKQKVVVK